MPDGQSGFVRCGPKHPQPKGYMADMRLQRLSGAYFPFDLPLSRKTWDTFHLVDLVPSVIETGSDQTTVYAMRCLADRINARWLSGKHGGRPLRAGLLITAALFSDVLRHLANQYVHTRNPGCLARALAWARGQMGAGVFEKTFHAFVGLFPPQAVQSGGLSVAKFLEGSSGDRPNREQAAIEMLILSLAVDNPALEPAQLLFDDEALRRTAPYLTLVEALEKYFEREPPVDWSGRPLSECLRAPVLASPDSLIGQLQYVLDHWAGALPTAILKRLELSLGIVREETQPRGFGPGPTEVAEFRKRGKPGFAHEPEPERFTEDTDWMAGLTLIAKSVHVWLGQLSKRYGRPVTRLDEIPDEALDLLAGWGFTGLWLIGVWERSWSSRCIKQRMGNQEAHASAYSIHDYVIAEALGGAAALENLRHRASRRGIRLASDMVPNHMGIYSRWVAEHPDWFLQLDQPPFPGYRFTGPDLSPDPKVGIFIEDGYWERRDAAVVFKRVDNETGRVTYIYHGNDGTNMPWNDTAQLDYLKPEVREAVIEAIVRVADMFPVIRFDAAMTLTKRHYHRLWFPTSEEAGAVPSRAEHGMTKAEFDERMPQEFWGEVVDRVTIEEPSTVLLAEAFWLMEGYFVRSLGMHRVYNSAFMNMLKMEENAKYRATVKNVLEYSPEILKRFVNFMSNPDEATALEQFGKGDKYFGVATLMVTMPGLPMFGHGQIEGLGEKYGMEYRSAYWEEPIDEGLVHRHEVEIFPLMKKRHLFSGVEHFSFYDYVTPEGDVDENVFAYSNRAGDECALILYNNGLATTRGLIHTSSPINVGTAETPVFRAKALADALELRTEPTCYHIFRDRITGLEYIRQGRDLAERGLFVKLRGYQCCVFSDFREVKDTDHAWASLTKRLAGQGVPDMEEAYQEVVLAPLLEAFDLVMNAHLLHVVAAAREDEAPQAPLRDCLEGPLDVLLDKIEQRTHQTCDRSAIFHGILRELDTIRTVEARLSSLKVDKAAMAYLCSQMPAKAEDRPVFLRIPIAWTILHRVELAFPAKAPLTDPPTWIDEWLPGKAALKAFTSLGREEWLAQLDVELVKILTQHVPTWVERASSDTSLGLRALFADPLVRDYLYMNTYDGILWLNKEQVENLLYWLFFVSVVYVMADSSLSPEAQAADVSASFNRTEHIIDAVHRACYQVDRSLELLSS